ncbi:metallophosphoesterase [Sedimentitalea sp. JM2-8]|uniref:Metallophosphoesterase n=1 Tax=Sedimentitalea xiamensis TaxID=3050037 RepID=A0ABT7F981_9RHOB|nr:metallophosphoesterase [Sedimentitalea xiamensis]MDK3071646.1 metallophosphoesterase [Sedimentitalea xiamensis]
MTDPIYAIGDIHGQIGFLEAALDLIAADGGTEAETVFLGDLVDRGPDSQGVIERLMQAQAAGRDWHVLKGNHDRMFHRFVTEGTEHDARILSGLGWLNPRLGGLGTLASYGVDVEAIGSAELLSEAARKAVPQAHLDYVNTLPVYRERGDLLFVHAGIAPGVPLAEQTEDDLIWIRDPFLKHTRRHPWLVVHGHTALDMPFHFGNRIDLDGGAGYGRPIYPAVFEGTDCWLLTEGGRIPLVP